MTDKQMNDFNSKNSAEDKGKKANRFTQKEGNKNIREPKNEYGWVKKNRN